MLSGLALMRQASFFECMFFDLPPSLDDGPVGASSHSGRRTLLTNMARRCAQAGASLRDVQRIAGHADLGTTERYVEPSLDTQKRLIALA